MKDRNDMQVDIRSCLLALAVVDGIVQAQNISLLSWNLLGPVTQDVSHFGFIQKDYGRLAKSLQIIQEYHADILCFQEVDLTALHFLNNFFLGTYYQAAYHEKGAHGGVVMYVASARFDTVQSYTLRLHSGNDRAPGAFAGATILDKQTCRTLLVGSVHLSKSSDRRALGAGLSQVSDIFEALQDVTYDGAIFAGDYNTLYYDMADAIVPHVCDVTRKKFEIFQHDSCTASRVKGGCSAIDHVIFTGLILDERMSRVGKGQFQNNQIRQASDAIDTLNFAAIYTEYPSDHAPVYAVFKMTQIQKNEIMERYRQVVKNNQR